MVASQIVHRVPAVASSYAAAPVFVHERLLTHGINGGKIVADGLAAPVT
jgi:hypothetical protein